MNTIFIYLKHDNETLSANSLINSLFTDVYISANCRFLYAQETIHGYEFWDIYREAKNLPFQFFYIGQWIEMTRNFTNLPLLPNIYQQRYKFENLTLKVGIIHVNVFFFLIILPVKTVIMRFIVFVEYNSNKKV